MDIKIYLRDYDPSVVDAWKKVFAGYPNFTLSCGDIFGIQADAIISPANSFGFMDG
jgi:hypothetical protein